MFNIITLPTVSLCGRFESLLMSGPPTESMACRVTKRHDARASQRVTFLRFSTNFDYGYVNVNRTVFLFFIFFILASLFAHLLDFLYNV